MRIRLEEEDFDALISGKVISKDVNVLKGGKIEVQKVEILLADIGYDLMEKMLQEKIRDFKSS